VGAAGGGRVLPASVPYKGVENAVLLDHRPPPWAPASTSGRRRSRPPPIATVTGWPWPPRRWPSTSTPRPCTRCSTSTGPHRPECAASAYARDVVGRLVENGRRAFADQVGLLAGHIGVPV
jgi:hypothetical protein